MTPIVYFEDPTYTQVKTARGREIVRRWKYILERRGIYNASLSHVCSDECFEPLDHFAQEIEKDRFHLPNQFKSKLLKRKPQWSIESDYNPLKLRGHGVKEEEKDPDNEQDSDREEDADYATNSSISLSESGALPKATPAKKTQEDHIYVEAIDVKEGIYGCPRHATLHVCDSNIDVRKQHCLVRFEDRFGAICCRFSAREIEPAPSLYNPFTEMTMGLISSKKYDEWHESLGKDHERYGPLSQKPEQSGRPNTMVSLRNATEKKQELGMAKGLSQLAARRTTTASSSSAIQDESVSANDHVVPSLHLAKEGAIPTKRLTHSDIIPAPSTMMARNHAGASSSPHPLVTSRSLPVAINVQGRPISTANGYTRDIKNIIYLPYQLQVSRDALAKIRKVVMDILADPVCRKHLGIAPALDPVNNKRDERFITLCSVRAAIFLALINAEGASKRINNKNNLGSRRSGCLTVNIRNLAVTTLYLYGHGYNIEGQNFIPADSRLQKLLPAQNKLPWFGIKEDILKQITTSEFKANTGANSLIKSFQIYGENMASSEKTKIQHVISENIKDTAYGRNTMARMLNLSESALESFGENGFEEVTYEGDGTDHGIGKRHKKSVSDGDQLMSHYHDTENGDDYSVDDD